MFLALPIVILHRRMSVSAELERNKTRKEKIKDTKRRKGNKRL